MKMCSLKLKKGGWKLTTPMTPGFFFPLSESEDFFTILTNFSQLTVIS